VKVLLILLDKYIKLKKVLVKKALLLYIVQLVKKIQKTSFFLDNKFCLFFFQGAGRTGVFLTLSIVLERIRYEGVVDVFQTVKLLRTQRPALVQTEVKKKKINFCYFLISYLFCI
jgi:protein tyrosine phosphatase